MRIIGIRAANKRVERVEPVDQVSLDEEFQRSINRRGRGVVPITPESVQDVVGAYRLMTVPHQFKYPPPLSGESQPLLPANMLGSTNCLRHATVVVVLPGRETPRRKNLIHRILLFALLMEAIVTCHSSDRTVAWNIPGGLDQPQYSVQ